MYMTLIHWMAIVVFVLLFIILSLLSLKEKKKNVIFGMIFSSFLVTALGGVVSIFVIDKYTKKGKILSYTQKRNLANETIMFTGQVQNIGNFKIGYCTIEVKLTNNAMKMGRPKESFFKPNTSLGPLFSPKEMKSSVVKEEFTVVKNLGAKKVKNFRIYMKYPPYMKAPGLKLTLNCH
ncbi:MAG TPA: DUF2393 domain-containing protein [Campylobacterales bacterium]|nr:DUF2393 domain-containing protein [Campylobacterales bacterium]